MTELIEPFMDRPHLVVLTPEAAAEAFPKGDRNGKRVPDTHDIVAATGITEDLAQLGISRADRPFDDIRRELYARPENAPAAARIEQKVSAYFSGLRLPEQLTPYDHLVLSLRPKDVIASFAWDPLLHDVCLRNRSFAPLPRVLYLVGTVLIGTCRKHRVPGNTGTACAQCGAVIEPPNMPSMDLRTNRALKKNLKDVIQVLDDALLVTFIGPVRSSVARDLLRMAEERTLLGSLQEIEIVTRKSTIAALQAAISHRQQVSGSFYDSRIAKHPRRSCEAAWSQYVEAKYVPGTDIPRDRDRAGLHDWFRPLVEAEQQAAAKAAASAEAAKKTNRRRQALRDEISGTWSTMRPTAPGLYLNAKHGGKPHLVEIGGDPAAQKGLYVRIPGEEKKYPLDEWKEPLWKGPISPPH